MPSLAQWRRVGSTVARHGSHPAAVKRVLEVHNRGWKLHLLMLTRSNQQSQAQSHIFAEDDALRRQLLYRSKQRGWLEMDIMLGDWAAANLKDLNRHELKLFQQVIELENPDLFRWLTGQEKIPDEMDNSVLRRLVEDLRGAREPKLTVQSAVQFEGKEHLSLAECCYVVAFPRLDKWKCAETERALSIAERNKK